MVDLLKAFGRGILYILCFPFFLVALAIFAVIGLLAFIFQLIKSIIYFFTGQKFFPELPEDKELRLMREAEEAKNNPQPEAQAVNRQPQQGNGLLFEETYDEDDFMEEPSPAPAPAAAQQPQPTTIEQAVFVDEQKATPLPASNPAPASAPQQAPESVPQPTPEPAPQPQTQEQVKNEQAPVQEDKQEEVLDDFLDPFDAEQEETEEEELEIYQPKGTTDDIYQADDDEDTDTGVNINYND